MPGDMGIMDPSDHTAECALPRLHDGQCANVPPCPGTALPALADQPARRCTKGLGHKGACADDAGELLGDATDPGYADRLAKLRNRAEAIIKADPAPGSRADREEDRDVKESLRRRAETHPEDPLPQREPGAALNCVELSAHGDMCTLPYGHDGMHERHWIGKRVASWETPTCESRPEPYGWATRDTRCIGRAGHDGLHGDGNGLEWKAGTTEADAPKLRVTALNPQPVRVRFVDLPHRDVPREVDGIPLRTIEPGGFALVVDRFRDAGHRGSELTRWELFGAAIGAHTVLCYPGELDIVGWLDGS